MTIDLMGETFIAKKTGITSSIFKTVPDVPVDGFELELPQAHNSALATAHGNLCGAALKMPTTIEGQNGAVLEQTTNVVVTGCTVKKASKKKAKRKAKKSARASTHHRTATNARRAT